MHAAIESPNQADVIALIAELDAYQDTLYPAEARYALDLASLCQPNVRFVVAREACGTAVGCGAVVLCDDFAEIKRMYVSPRARGQGVARSIIQALEAAALSADYRVLTLETGPYQSAALAFYAQQGYERCGPFGSYPKHPLSVFMTKTLAY
jgi:putative acetyltransferase